ncbi:hypothetical protein D5F53_04970 [Paenibacillus lautus]|jgi:hypothetical protein|uniref:Uncharacterized protein n=1 Tax=Paenibacillus lautus TaxID=1401 RepID=A0A385TJ56_PAELA|nr:hypothetical protein D5F53_04970 [Paenibacillus lautus]
MKALKVHLLFENKGVVIYLTSIITESQANGLLTLLPGMRDIGAKDIKRFSEDCQQKNKALYHRLV